MVFVVTFAPVTALLMLAACSSSRNFQSTATTVPRSAIPTTVAPSTIAPSSTVPETVPTNSGLPASEPVTTVPPPTVAPTTTTLADPVPPAAALEGLALSVAPIADLNEATGLAWRADDPGLYITVQRGQIYRVEGDIVTVVADLSAETTEVEPGSERGLLGIAFDPRDGRMFINFTGRDNNTRVVSYLLSDGVILPESRRELLFVEQPGLGHNGGHLVFDQVGNLFIGMGDGGGSNGRDAQDRTKILGAILRVLPRLDADGYDIPPDNPFADGVADRPEVWARGFRNPWMFSIDQPTGDMWIGDVGNESLEEVDIIRAGETGLNFGWYYFEGLHQRYSDVPEGMTPPLHEYPHSVGTAVMGGFVYRGSAIPQLRGAYVFGDVEGKVWAFTTDGVVRLDIDDVGYLFGWGQDANGELYLLSMSEGVYRLAPG